MTTSHGRQIHKERRTFALLIKCTVMSTVVCAGMGGFVVCVAGNVVSEGGGLGVVEASTWIEYEHGWPMVAATRVVVNEHSTRFSLWHGDLEWDSVAIVVDSVVVLSLLMSCGYATWHIARQKKATSWSLRTLIFLVFIVCLVAAHVRMRLVVCKRAQEAARILDRSGCTVEYGYGGPRWLQRLCDDQFTRYSIFDCVRSVGVYGVEEEHGTQVRDALAQCDGIRGVRFDGSPFMPGTLMSILELPSLANLRLLSLSRSRINSDCSRSIVRLVDLERLYLNGTDVDDAFVESLGGLARLKELDLSGTRVTFTAEEISARIPSVRIVQR